jgi:hypothetical protein
MTDQSAITHNPGGSTTLTGDAIKLYAAAQLRGFIKLYMQTKLIPTRGVTISHMLKLATQTTGKAYKNNAAGWQAAIDDLDRWVQTMKAAIPHVDGDTGETL